MSNEFETIGEALKHIPDGGFYSSKFGIVGRDEMFTALDRLRAQHLAAETLQASYLTTIADQGATIRRLEAEIGEYEAALKRRMLEVHRGEDDYRELEVETERLRDRALDLDDATIERAAIALWRLDHPEDGEFSRVAPNDWGQWPETPRQASLAHEDHSRQEYRGQARAALSAAIERAKEAG